VKSKKLTQYGLYPPIPPACQLAPHHKLQNFKKKVIIAWPNQGSNLESLDFRHYEVIVVKRLAIGPLGRLFDCCNRVIWWRRKKLDDTDPYSKLRIGKRRRGVFIPLGGDYKQRREVLLVWRRCIFSSRWDWCARRIGWMWMWMWTGRWEVGDGG
jgi:hypothetical protein